MRFLLTLMVGVVLAPGVSVASGFDLGGAPRPAFVYVGARNDQGWNEAGDRARSQMEKTIGLEIPYAEQVAADGVVAATDNFIGRGYNIIVGDSADYAEAFKALAQTHPKTVFINLQDARPAPSGPINLLSVSGRSYESQYLCGVAAGMATKAGNIGFVAARPTSVANWEINAYTLGVLLSHPDARVHVVFIGTPDAAKERAASSTLIDRGADVLAQSVDGPTPQLVASERGVLATGHAVDLHELAPKSTICSSVWNWDHYLVREIKKIAAGNWAADADGGLIGMVGGSNDISCCSTAVPEKAIPKMIAERDGIIITRNPVFKGPLRDVQGKERVKAGVSLSDDELWRMNWYVKAVQIEK